MLLVYCGVYFFFFKQKTAYEMRISDWSSDVCSSDLHCLSITVTTNDEARAALDVGAAVAAELVGAGARALVTGDMGIGNTTASAAVIAALTGSDAGTV